MTSTTRRALPALLLSAVVLAVAFAGGATAAKMITGKQIKNNTVTTKDIKNKSLKGLDVKDGSLTGADVKDGSLAEADLNAAAKSKLNAPSVAGYEVVQVSEEIESDGEATVYVACTTGKVAVGGGGIWEDLTVTTAIEGSKPMKVIGDFFAEPDAGFADAWGISGKHNGLNPQDLTAFVICVSPS
jgi:hypothetical protein